MRARVCVCVPFIPMVANIMVLHGGNVIFVKTSQNLLRTRKAGTHSPAGGTRTI